MSDEEIYNRQEKLQLNIPPSATIIGLGGIGSWVALNLALTGTKKLILVDFDVIEKHNLNRTPFKLNNIGELKVQAVAELIMERREDVELLLINKHVEDLTNVEIQEIKDTAIIVDCRDNIKPLPFKHKYIVKLGYDGSNFTIHIRPQYKPLWGDGNNGYTVIPSWLGTPQFLANFLITYFCLTKGWQYDWREQIFSANLIDVVKTMVKKFRRYQRANRVR